MELIASNYSATGNPAKVIVKHGDRELIWDVSWAKTSSGGVGSDRTLSQQQMFADLNLFLQTLRPNVHDELFELYQRIFQTFEDIEDKTDLTNQLVPQIKELFELIDLNAVHYWVTFNAKSINIPSTLLTQYDAEDVTHTPERTYLRADYVWLVALGVTLRAMTPIWGEYITRTQKLTGTQWKEYEAFKLLSMSNVDKSVPMERLRTYIDALIPKDKDLSAAIISGISSEHFPTWVLALTVIRRLIVADLSGQNPNQSLMGSIHRYMNSKITGPQNGFMGIIKDKPMADSSGDVETNLSQLERYRMRQELAAGDIAMMEHYINSFVKRTGPPQPCSHPPVSASKAIFQQLRQTREGAELLRQSLQAISNLDHSKHRVWPGQIALIQIVISSLVSPRGIDYVSKQAVLNAAAIAQSWLVLRGHHELGWLITARQEEEYFGGNQGRSRLSRELQERLDQIYPYARMKGGSTPERAKNPGCLAVDAIEDLLSCYDWYLTVPAEWLGQTQRRYSIPQDIKTKLALLLIDLHDQA